MNDQAEALKHALVRNWKDLETTPGALTAMVREPLYRSSYGSLTQGTKAAKLGAGYDVLAPHARSCPYHYHLAQEEMFVILEGEGTLRVAGEMIAVRAGDVITIPAGPEYPHHLLNTSDAPMRYLSISTQERPEVCVYPDSDKVGVFSKDIRLIARTQASLDYWEGEDTDHALASSAPPSTR